MSLLLRAGDCMEATRPRMCTRHIGQDSQTQIWRHGHGHGHGNGYGHGMRTDMGMNTNMWKCKAMVARAHMHTHVAVAVAALAFIEELLPSPAHLDAPTRTLRDGFKVITHEQHRVDIGE